MWYTQSKYKMYKYARLFSDHIRIYHICHFARGSFQSHHRMELENREQTLEAHHIRTFIAIFSETKTRHIQQFLLRCKCDMCAVFINESQSESFSFPWTFSFPCLCPPCVPFVVRSIHLNLMNYNHTQMVSLCACVRASEYDNIVPKRHECAHTHTHKMMNLYIQQSNDTDKSEWNEMNRIVSYVYAAIAACFMNVFLCFFLFI